MVFVAVSLPTLASNVMSQYSPAIEGNVESAKYLHEWIVNFLHNSPGSFLNTFALNIYSYFVVNKF